MDSSSNIEYYGKGNYQRMRKFVQRLIASFAVGRRLAHISVTLFSTRPQLLFGFSHYYSKYQMMRAVGRAPYIKAKSKAGLGLEFVRRRVFRLGRRPRSRKRRNVLVVITSTPSLDRIKKAALRLKKAGVNVLAVGVGKAFSPRDLRLMASNRKNVFTGGFKTLQNIAAIVKRRACISK